MKIRRNKVLRFLSMVHLSLFFFFQGVILLNPNIETFLLDKYTFSDAIASSVKLGAWEAALGRHLFFRFC